MGGKIISKRRLKVASGMEEYSSDEYVIFM